MTNAYSSDDLLEFLDHAGDKGLLTAATAKALAVATRNVLGVLSDQEKKDLSNHDIDGIIKRFTNKRANDFNPSSLKEYSRRVQRAVELFLKWREDPANFRVKTRSTSITRKKGSAKHHPAGSWESGDPSDDTNARAGSYDSSVPVRAGVVVTLANVPHDLTRAEAERLVNFVRMLAIDAD
ncbi:MAG: hypothetical protein ACT4OZ_01300 [Gemmatimonadota bacterium]